MAHKLLSVVRGLVAVVLMLFATNFAPVAAAYADTSAQVDSVVSNQTIYAKALTNHECNADEWHFVITKVTPESNAPSSITVNFANNDTVQVPLLKYTGKTAHYTTTSNLDSTVTSATASIYAGWAGQFNLSHGPCGETTQPTTPTVAATALACKDGDTTTDAKVTVTNNATTSVTYTVSVPGATSQNLTLAAGATDFVTFSGLSAGSHTATVTASGQNTATADFEVSNCDTTPTPTTPTVSAMALACKDGDTTTDASVTVTNNATTSVTYTVSVLGASDHTLTLAAGATGSVTFSGLAKGKYTATVSATGQNTATAKFTVKACKTKPVKVYVCKYVGTPGVNERLKKGNHGLVLVSTHAIAQNGWDGTVGSATSWFSDAQGRSYVLGYESDFNVPPTAADCPAPQGPTNVTPAVQFSEPTCENTSGRVTVTAMTGVTYKVNGHVVTGTTSYTAGSSVTVTVELATGYVLASGAHDSFTHDFAAAPTGCVLGSTDVCPNITGDQATVPSGMTKDSTTGNCVTTTVTGGKGGDVLGASTTTPQLANTGQSPWATIIIGLTVLGLTLGSAIVSRKPRLEA